MKTTLILALTLLALPLRALEDTPANREKEADRYLQATPPKEMFEDVAVQMAKTLPEDQREDYKAILMKYIDIAAVTKLMKNAMVKNFTADELKALADFYGSPVGKAAMKKFGVYMADVMPGLQKEIQKAQAKATLEKK